MNKEMWKRKQMRWLAVLALIIVICFVGCGKEEAKTDESTTVERETTTKAPAPSVEIEDDDLVYVHANMDGTEREEGEDLPLALKVSYALDGEAISPEELAGRSGHLTMHFDYENLTSYEATVGEESVRVCAPLMAMTLLLLDEEVFSNVTTENGEIYAIGEEKMAVGTVYPGLSESLKLADWETTKEMDLAESFTVDADVTDFTLSFTATVVQVLDLSELEEEDLKDMEDLAKGLDDLEDATDELKDGAGEFSSAAKTVKSGVSSYVDGAGKVADGLSSAASGAKTLEENGSALKDGADGIASGASSLSSGLDSLSELLSQIPVDADSEDPQAQAQAQMIAQAKQIAAQLSSAGSSLSEGSKQLSSGISSYTEGVSSLSSGLAQLASGAKQLKSSGSDVKKGLSSLTSAASELEDAVNDFTEDGLKELTEKAGPGMKTVITRLRAVKEAGQQYRYPGVESEEVRFIYETEELK